MAHDMAARNPTRIHLLEKLEKLVEQYNLGTLHVEAFFEALKALIAAMEEEERRAAREGLSEDELAVFDLLTKPKPKLSKAQEVAVKKVARELLEKLQDQLTVAEWQTKQQTRAAVQSTIRFTLNELPGDSDWLALLLEHEATLRQLKRFDARIKTARMRYQARVEDVNYRAPRGLDRALFLKLNCLIVHIELNLAAKPCGIASTTRSTAPASRRTKQLRYDRAARKPLSRCGAVEGALARGLLRHAPTTLHPCTCGITPRVNRRASAAHAGHSCKATPCTPNPGSLTRLQDPLGRR
jgi:hypothetical protein